MKYIEYKAEKNSNPLNIVIAVLICSIVAVGLGWLYSIIAFIPLVYFNYLLTLGFGFALAFSVQIVSKFLKIKNKKSRLIVVILVAIIAYYSHWISYIVQVYTEQFPNFNDYISYWVFPKGIFEAITEINKFGTWSLKETAVSGVTLSLIWFIEALIILLIPIVHVYRFPENPFSEKLNNWYPKIVLKKEFNSIYSIRLFKLNLEELGINVIINLENGLAYKYAKISVFYLEGEDKQYLSIDNIYIEVKNNSKKNVTKVVKPIEISTADAKKLFAKFDTEKEFYLDY